MDRVKELALQSANEIADQFNAGFFDDRMVNDVAGIIQKSAELIIKDCIDNVKVWEKDSRNHISYMLKNHYGVK